MNTTQSPRSRCFTLVSTLATASGIVLLAGCAQPPAERSASSKQAVGNFPSSVTAPYVPTYDSSIDGASDLPTLSSTTGNKYWTLAFVISNGYCTPSWNGYIDLGSSSWASSISRLRDQGGDAIISFGGADGTELAYSCGSVGELQAAYQSVIDAYGASSLDFDVEDGNPVGDAVENTTANRMRSQALANLQKANPGLQASFTLATDPSGLPGAQLAVVQDAVNTGVDVGVVNVMAMDYGSCNQNMGENAIDAAQGTARSLSNAGISARVGVTPLVGTNDTTCEVFSTTDAQNLVSYAVNGSPVTRLSYWAQDIDSSSYGDAYVQIFEQFNGANPGSGGSTGGGSGSGGSSPGTSATCASYQGAYGGTAWTIPGKIEAENYDLCGQNWAYYDTTAGNTGGAYRNDDVDIEATSDTGGGYDVGWIAATEWLNFSSNVTTGGTYQVQLRVAATDANETMRVQVDGTDATGAISIPNTGGWQTWTTVTSPPFSMTAGSHILAASFTTGNVNLNWMNFQLAGASAGSNPPPSSGSGGPRAELLGFLDGLSGRTVAGEHNRESTEGDFIQSLADVTGHYPGLWGGDFLFESNEIANRPNMIAHLMQGYRGGAIVSLMYHACPPTEGESCSWDDIGGASPVHLSDAQWSDLVTDGGSLNAVWKSRLDAIAPYFQQLKNAGMAALFRPQHEMNQGVFWWGGRPGPGGTSALYQVTHDYLTSDWGLDNIVWVWSVQDIPNPGTGGWDWTAYNPGEGYWDVMSLDFYNGDGYTQSKYQEMLKEAGNKPIAIGECEQLPTPAQLSAQPRWTYFMGWAELIQQNDSNAQITATYTAPQVLTQDEMPGW